MNNLALFAYESQVFVKTVLIVFAMIVENDIRIVAKLKKKKITAETAKNIKIVLTAIKNFAESVERLKNSLIIHLIEAKQPQI